MKITGMQAALAIHAALRHFPAMRVFICSLLCLSLLAACGHKTDLRLPDEEKPAKSQTLL